ncbi:MAG TPA: DUF397 domain-containing protein [Actinophytocola sp.]|uniref:DUF397 domain-containing protein n=1 Tax=Actinophytocola sp. TaxID=1872138 RepID=UPI002DF77065|nr:DUF397 domain-containing protein [Actinophytocola sp.]
MRHHVEFSYAVWRKSSFSGSETACVEIAYIAEAPTVSIRDSKNPAGGVLRGDLAGLLDFVRRDTGSRRWLG